MHKKLQDLLYILRDFNFLFLEILTNRANALEACVCPFYASKESSRRYTPSIAM